MVRHDFNSVSDEEFDLLNKKCDMQLEKYIKDNIVNDYVAYYIAIRYNSDAIWSERLNMTIGTAIEELSYINESYVDKERVINILKNKYKLEIVSDYPLEISKCS